MLHDQLSNALSNIMNHEKIGKSSCTVKSSKVIKKVLEIMQENKYLGSYEEKETTRGNDLNVNLIGSINKCGVIKPRHAVSYKNFVKFETRYLPAKDFGILIVSTSKGIMTQIQANEKKIGGKLLAYCY